MLSAPSLLDIIGEARISDDAEDFTNLTLLDELAHLDTQREVASPHSLHEEEILLASSLEQNGGLGSIDGQGLLTQDVLAGFQGQHGILEVVGVWGRDVDDVDVGVGDELIVGAVCSTRGRDANARDELVGLALG